MPPLSPAEREKYSLPKQLFFLLRPCPVRSLSPLFALLEAELLDGWAFSEQAKSLESNLCDASGLCNTGKHMFRNVKILEILFIRISGYLHIWTAFQILSLFQMISFLVSHYARCSVKSEPKQLGDLAPTPWLQLFLVLAPRGHMWLFTILYHVPSVCALSKACL